jgi:excisionase family DNA binding protein
MHSNSMPLGKSPEKVPVHIAARITKIPERTLRRCILNKELPAERRGKRAYIIRRSDIPAFLKRRRSRRCE